MASVEFGDAARARRASEKARAVPPAPSPSARGQRRPMQFMPSGAANRHPICAKTLSRGIPQVSICRDLPAQGDSHPGESYDDAIIRVARG